MIGESCVALQIEVAKRNNIVFLDLELTALPSDLSSSILEIAVLITGTGVLVPLFVTSDIKLFVSCCLNQLFNLIFLHFSLFPLLNLSFPFHQDMI
jgi:hypothetical protein